MSKNKFKQSKILFFFLLTFLLFYSCEKDLDNDSQQQSKYIIETIDQNQLESNSQIISQLDKLGLIKGKNGNIDSSKNIYYSNLGFTIYTDSIKHVLNIETGVHSFNFSIVRDSLITYNLENLLLQSNDEDEYDAYIVEYGFTNDQLSSLDDTLLNNTTTKYTPIEFDTSIFNNNELAKTYPELVCVEIWVFTTVPNDQGNLNGDTPVFTQEWILESSSCTWTTGGGSSSSGSTDGGSDGSGSTSGGTTGGGTDPGSGGQTSTPVGGGIRNETTPCEPAPEGDINGDCMISYYEACLLDGNNESICSCTIDGTDILTCKVKDCLGDSYNSIFEELSSEIRAELANYLTENNCSNDAHNNVLEVLENEVSTYPYPHCSSFEFAQPAGESVKACAVLNLSESFHSYTINADGSFGYYNVDVNYPLVFFTMPTWMTNGQAATLTAHAVNQAFNTVSNWFHLNPTASEFVVGQQLNLAVVASMNAIGGTMTQTPPFNIPSPAPFITSFVSTGNCY